MKWHFWKKVDFLVLSDGGKIVDCQDLLQRNPSKQKYPETVRSRILLCFSWFSFKVSFFLELLLFRSFIHCVRCVYWDLKSLKGLVWAGPSGFSAFRRKKYKLSTNTRESGWGVVWSRTLGINWAYKRHIITPSFLSCNFAKAQLIKINKKTSFIPLFQVKYNWIVKW